MIAPASWASLDITVKIVTPTFGSLDDMETIEIFLNAGPATFGVYGRYLSILDGKSGKIRKPQEQSGDILQYSHAVVP